MNSLSIEILFRLDCTACHQKGTGSESHRFPSPLFFASGFGSDSMKGFRRPVRRQVSFS
jgi:hypothetical protein